MSDLLIEALERDFGHGEFRGGQRQVIETLLAGRSAAAVFPTGGGKSLCYQLPALQLEGTTIVVSPLIALMKDQIDALHRRGHAAARLDSSLDADQYRELMDDLRGGRLKLLYVAPERFTNERFLETVRSLDVALFAVDEAHCISEWGHNFRPDYLKLVGFARECGAERCLALTATATPEVLEDICRQFDIAAEDAVRTPFHRENLSLQLTPCDAASRDGLLEQRLRERPRGATIVYVTLQRTAERVAGLLEQAGLPARPYHAGLAPERRHATQEWFFERPDAIVVATIAFGMGIDKADIRAVYHYNLAKSLENYSQEIGRAGRDGLPAVCETLVCADDLNALENFVYGDTPSEESVQELVELLFGRSLETELEGRPVLDLALQELSARTDIRVLVLRTLLTVLELDGTLRARTPYFASFRFHPKVSSSEMLERFEGARRDFLRDLLRRSKKARKWFDLDVDEASLALRTPRERIVRALDYLAEQDLIELQTQGVRHRYEVVQRPDPDELAMIAEELHGRCAEREHAELQRLQQMLGLVTLDRCQASALSAHFGEDVPNCGSCTWCERGPVELIAAESSGDDEADERVWAAVDALRAEHEVLASPRSLARFLCGISSPRLARARLGRHELAGALAERRFADVLERAELSGSDAG